MSRPRLLLAIVLVALLLFSMFGEHAFAGTFSYYHAVLIQIGINIILGASLNLVNGYTGQFSLGHAGFMAVGAYASASWSDHVDRIFWGVLKDPALVDKLKIPAELVKALNPGGFLNPFAVNGVFLVSLLVGGLLAAFAGLIVGIPSLRLRGDYLAIMTLGFGEIIRTAILNIDFLGASRGYNGIAPYTNLFWTYGVAAVCIYVVLVLVNSTYGRGFLTVRDDEIAAEAMGINTTKYKVIAFVIGAFFAGIAGALFAHYVGFLTPEGFNFFKSVEVVVIVVLGGMGSTAGVVLTAAMLTLLSEAQRALAHTSFVPPQYRGLLENRLILYSLLLIVFMLTRPQGLFGDLSAVRKRLTPKTAKQKT
jgi:branched-chain amino acid transport system permease protein